MLMSGVRLRFMLQLCNTILARLGRLATETRWNRAVSENLWLQHLGISGVGVVVGSRNLWRDMNSDGIIVWSSFDYRLIIVWLSFDHDSLMRRGLQDPLQGRPGLNATNSWQIWSGLAVALCCTTSGITSYLLCIYFVHVRDAGPKVPNGALLQHLPAHQQLHNTWFDGHELLDTVGMLPQW